MPSFLNNSRASAHYSFTFNLSFLYEPNHKFRLSKTMCGIFQFWFRFVFLFLLKFIFFFNKIHGLAITLKRHNSFQNYNNRKATHSFSPRFLIFKLQQVLKSNNICVSCSCSKTDLETNFLNLENQSFEIVRFSQ